MADPSQWERLSISSKKALRFACAAARERAGADQVSAQVNSWDILVGILLSHPEESEAEQLFRHFGLVAGQALPDGYPQLTADGLNRRLPAVPSDEFPNLTDEALDLVNTAVRFSPAIGSSGVVELRLLWAALLEGTGIASVGLRELLTRRGIDVSLLSSQTREWVNADAEKRPPYQELLSRFRVAPIDVINYKADQPYRADRLGDSSSSDFVGISNEVDAFAYLIASRTLEPPLAIGLFGDWGSGKSHFLGAIQRRIDQLTGSEAIASKNQRDIPFWKRIVQVEFNAWHYVEGDLWSSLVDHIFTQLKLVSDDITNHEVENRQRFYLQKLETTAESLRRLEDEKEKLECDLESRRANVQALEERRKNALIVLETTQAEKIVASEVKQSKDSVITAVKSIGLTKEPEGLTFGSAVDSLAVTQAELTRARSLLRPVFNDPKLGIKLIIFVLVASLVPFVINRLTNSGVVAASAGLASIFAVAIKVLNLGTTWVSERLDEVEKARDQLRVEQRNLEANWHSRLERAKNEVSETTDLLAKNKVDQSRLAEEVENIELELAKRPSELLYKFLQERLEAGEYRKRLGVPAIIRRDFKGLADFISHQNAFLLAPVERTLAPVGREDRIPKEEVKDLLPEDDNFIINRIVLYIDDLDRCPDAKVIEVLQAVHLLLAFPLFVVVVAVDSRWLAHALQTQFPALAELPSSSRKSNPQPDDYLEKIFQVPFWVQELANGSKSRIVQGLLGNHIRGDSTPQINEGVDGLSIGPSEARVLAEMLEARGGPPHLDVAALTVTREELAALDRLAPLMGDTPRSIKRFVNVYQLLKIMRRNRTPTAGVSPTDEEIAAFLLAVTEGMPGLGWLLLDSDGAIPDPLKQTLSTFIDGPGFVQFQAERDRLKDWLSDEINSAWNSVPIERLREVGQDVRRFVFRIAPDTH